MARLLRPDDRGQDHRPERHLSPTAPWSLRRDMYRWGRARSPPLSYSARNDGAGRRHRIAGELSHPRRPVDERDQRRPPPRYGRTPARRRAGRTRRGNPDHRRFVALGATGRTLRGRDRASRGRRRTGHRALRRPARDSWRVRGALRRRRRVGDRRTPRTVRSRADCRPLHRRHIPADPSADRSLHDPRPGFRGPLTDPAPPRRRAGGRPGWADSAARHQHSAPTRIVGDSA